MAFISLGPHSTSKTPHMVPALMISSTHFRHGLTVKRPTYTLCDFEQDTLSEPQFFPENTFIIWSHSNMNVSSSPKLYTSNIKMVNFML